MVGNLIWYGLSLFLSAYFASAETAFTAVQQNLVLVSCVDKMATLPDSGEMAVRDAMSLCYTGVQLKENL